MENDVLEKVIKILDEQDVVFLGRDREYEYYASRLLKTPSGNLKIAQPDSCVKFLFDKSGVYFEAKLYGRTIKKYLDKTDVFDVGDTKTISFDFFDSSKEMYCFTLKRYELQIDYWGHGAFSVSFKQLSETAFDTITNRVKVSTGSNIPLTGDVSDYKAMELYKSYIPSLMKDYDEYLPVYYFDIGFLNRNNEKQIRDKVVTLMANSPNNAYRYLYGALKKEKLFLKLPEFLYLWNISEGFSWQIKQANALARYFFSHDITDIEWERLEKVVDRRKTLFTHNYTNLPNDIVKAIEKVASPYAAFTVEQDKLFVGLLVAWSNFISHYDVSAITYHELMDEVDKESFMRLGQCDVKIADAALKVKSKITEHF